MAFVQKAVARLDEKEKLDKLLEELGKAHFYYGAPKKYIDVREFQNHLNITLFCGFGCFA